MSETPSFTDTDPRVKMCTGDCGRLTRHAKMAGPLYPGTVTRGTGGRCTKCQNVWRREQMDPTDRELDEARKRKAKERGVASAFAARDAYLAGRRRREAQRRVLDRLSA